VRGELSFRSKTYTAQNLDPLLVQPAYALANARVGVKGTGWALEFWGRNLTDETVLYRGGTPPAVFTAGSRIRFIGDPRTYGATLRFSF
jgi:iron complex outermembrane receptor protein